MMQHPTIRSARYLAKTGQLDGVLIVSFAGGNVATTSYGATKAQCAGLAKLNEYIFNAMVSGAVSLDEFSPTPTEEGERG